MKIIQSFWSGNRNPLEHNYGWNSIESHCLSWVLSVNQLRTFYDEVELYTDKLGYELLIGKLNLPYTKIHVVLDELSTIPNAFWAAAKVKVYAMQTEPFLHVDGDVFIWKSFTEKLLSSDLIVQNYEKTSDYYRSSWDLISPKLSYKPSEMIEYDLGKNYACNMGIFGGNDISFLNEYANRSLEFVMQNMPNWNLIKDLDFNIFFEQVLFGQMTLNAQKKVGFLIEDEIYDNGYKNFGDFDKVPYEKTYLHLLGNFKRDAHICKMMESYILKYYPTYFNKVVGLFPSIYSIDFAGFDFTYGNNNVWIKDLKLELKNRVILKEDRKFLISKELLSVELPGFFNEKIYLNKDFLITRLISNEVSESNNEGIKILSTKDFKNQIISFEIDEIDEVLLEKIGHSIQYKVLISEITQLLDENALEMQNEFVNLVTDKLYFFLKHKIIAVSD